MAAVHVTSAAANVNAATSGTVNFPANLRTTDHLLLAVAWTGTGVTLTAPTGWTAVGTASTGQQVNLSIWQRSANGAGTSQALTFSASTQASVALHVIAGQVFATPIAGSSIVNQGATTTTGALTGPTAAMTARDGVLVYHFFAVNPSSNSVTATFTPGTGLAEIVDTTSSGSSRNVALESARDTTQYAGGQTTTARSTTYVPSTGGTAANSVTGVVGIAGSTIVTRGTRTAVSRAAVA